MGISFAPGGNSDSFGRLKYPQDLMSYLRGFGLSGYEIECGRGVNISVSAYEYFPAISKEITVSLHAPYFISLSGIQESVRLNSVNYIYESAVAAHACGAGKVVVHSGSCSKMTREEALSLAADTLIAAQEKLDANGLTDIILCPETMGKINQLGTVEEVLSLCANPALSRLLPCIDFGHVNARTHGGLKTKADYTAIFDLCEAKIGRVRTANMHIHFSRIAYTKGGESKHLTFADTSVNESGEPYGPDYEPLIEIIKERAYTPSIVCESQGTQAEDAAVMRNYYDSL